MDDSNIIDAQINKEIETEVIRTLSEIDVIDDYIKMHMNLTMKRHFNAETDKQRNVLEGKFAFLLHLKKSIILARKDKLAKSR